jgi:hypothetical protein
VLASLCAQPATAFRFSWDFAPGDGLLTRDTESVHTHCDPGGSPSYLEWLDLRVAR